MTEQTGSAVRHETPDMHDEPRAPLRRVVGLFRPYRARLAIVAALIGLSSLVSLASPFMLRAILDDALPHGRDRPADACSRRHGRGRRADQRVRRAPDADLHRRRPAGHARPAHRRLRTCSACPWPSSPRTRTGEVQSRIANDIGGMQSDGHLHRDLDGLQPDHRGGDDHRDDRAGLAADHRVAAPAPLLRLDQPPGRPGTQEDHRRASAEDGRHVVDRPGVAVGQRHPAGPDHGPRPRAGRRFSRRLASSWSTWKSAPAWPGAGGSPRSRSSCRPCPR